MWINGGKRFHIMAGRDFERHARYSIDLCFGWRDDAAEGEFHWRHHWHISTYQLERRLRKWRIHSEMLMMRTWWSLVRWKWRTLRRLRDWYCEQRGGHIYEPMPEQLPYHIG